MNGENASYETAVNSFSLIISCRTSFNIVPITKLLLGNMLSIFAKKELFPYLTSNIYYIIFTYNKAMAYIHYNVHMPF